MRLTKQWLQTTVEELENSNEELKSSNEELISINEEYQSANEALQTSKEELQSLNEELETVNAEISKKVEELDLANADMQNLFASTPIATIFLDERLLDQALHSRRDASFQPYRVRPRTLAFRHRLAFRCRGNALGLAKSRAGGHLFGA